MVCRQPFLYKIREESPVIGKQSPRWSQKLCGQDLPKRGLLTPCCESRLN